LGLKIAITGKGGVGKTTLAAALSRLLAREGMRVIAVDADPDGNLAAALGVEREERKKIIPLSRQVDLIEEKTGIKPGESYGKAFILNPDVSDIIERFGIEAPDGVELIVAGTIEEAGGGCFCPESALLRSLFEHLVLERNDFVLFDMEAGLEHLGRQTTKGMDLLIVVVEPGMRSIETAIKIRNLAQEMGIEKIVLVLNKSLPEQNIKEKLGKLDLPVLGEVPYDENLIKSDVEDKSLFDLFSYSKAVSSFRKIASLLKEEKWKK
jgi:CO dehydrogenase maturation factor